MAEVELTNYEIHKQLYATLSKPNELTLKAKLVGIGAWFSTKPQSNYYMLLCREINYYTMFHFNDMNYDKGMEELSEVLAERGELVDIVYSADNDAYECWVKDTETDEISMYYLFEADWMVVEIE